MRRYGIYHLFIYKNTHVCIYIYIYVCPHFDIDMFYYVFMDQINEFGIDNKQGIPSSPPIIILQISTSFGFIFLELYI